MRLHKTFLNFSSGVVKIIFAKYTRKPNIFFKFSLNPKARYTLFANNGEIRAKRRKNDLRRIVYKRRSPCFANRFFAVRCTQDLRQGSGFLDEYKKLFRRKKIICRAKIDGEQRTVYSNTFVSFSPTIFYSAKK